MTFRESWFSPYPSVARGSDAAKEDLDNLDKDIKYLEEIYENLKERKARARDLKTDTATEETRNKIYSDYCDYLDVIQNLRRAENELHQLQEERLKLVVLADLAYQPDRRGDAFPHSNVENKAKELLQRQKDRLLAVSTVAFFGSGITFSNIMSGTRGSIGLMSYSWAAFSISFTICVYSQWTSPVFPAYTIVAYPGRRSLQNNSIFAAGCASFIGIILMGLSVAILDINREGDEIVVDTRINPSWAGILSLAPYIIGFAHGSLNLIYHAVMTEKQARVRRDAALRDLERENHRRPYIHT